MLIFVESAIVGFIGGLLGLGIGLIAVFSFTIARHWIPVFDIRLAPLAVVGGIVIGVLGGLLASFRASHIEPSEALRT
jgi:macrolide transport system ATP-binding/permease protein